MFIHVAFRRVIFSRAAFRPNEGWVKGQIKSIVKNTSAQGIKPSFVQHDRDKMFDKAFGLTLGERRVAVKIPEYRAPNANRFAESI